MSRFELNNNSISNLLRAMFGARDQNPKRASEFIMDQDDLKTFESLHDTLAQNKPLPHNDENLGNEPKISPV